MAKKKKEDFVSEDGSNDYSYDALEPFEPVVEEAPPKKEEPSRHPVSVEIVQVNRRLGYALGHLAGFAGELEAYRILRLDSIGTISRVMDVPAKVWDAAVVPVDTSRILAPAFQDVGAAVIELWKRGVLGEPLKSDEQQVKAAIMVSAPKISNIILKEK